MEIPDDLRVHVAAEVVQSRHRYRLVWVLVLVSMSICLANTQTSNYFMAHCLHTHFVSAPCPPYESNGVNMAPYRTLQLQMFYLVHLERFPET
jgi:hypothetical protein